MTVTKNNEGFALVITLVILVILSIVLLATFQNSSINLLINQNVFEKGGAQASAQVCEQHQSRRILSGFLDPITISKNAGGTYQVPNMEVNCQSSLVEFLGARYLPGNMLNLVAVDLRFSTTGASRRNANLRTYTYVTKPVNTASY